MKAQMMLTEAIKGELRKCPVGSQDGAKNPRIIVKFFTPWSNWTWYAIEGSEIEGEDWEFFGLVEGAETELGYFRLSELTGIRGPAGLRIERDYYFDGYVLNDDKSGVQKAESV